MLPTHRLVRLAESESMDGLREKLSAIFQVENLNPTGDTSVDILNTGLEVLKKRGEKGKAIGLYGLDRNRFCILLPRDGVNVQDMMPSDRSQLWKDLDVAILHWIILRHIIGIDTPQKEDCIDYTEEGLEAINRVDSGEYQLAFFMNPIPISRVLAVADAGDRMPQKFTYFYPKLPTGLTIHPLWDDL
jgi:uncharacterized protein (DUF1015 family)